MSIVATSDLCDGLYVGRVLMLLHFRNPVKALEQI